MKRISKCIIALLLTVIISGCAPTSSPATGGAAAQAPTVTATLSTAVTPTVAPTVTAEPKGVENLIIIIGDGMGQAHISAAQQVYGRHYGFTDWDSTLINTNAINEQGEASVLTDSAAAATAMATGVLTLRRRVGMDKDEAVLTTFLDLARQKGMVTGILTTETLLGATPAGFSAHVKNRFDPQAVLDSQIDSGLDLLCGAPDPICAANREQILQAGYYYCDDISGIDAEPSKKQYWQLDTLKTSPEVEPVSLAELSVAALDHLDAKGEFIMIIEQAHIDKFCHDNIFDKTVHSVDMLNSTVERVMEWVGERTDTAVMVLADHETGGLVLDPEAENSYFSPITGEQIAYEYTSTNHTTDEVKLFWHGFEPNIAALPYFGERDRIKNSDIFYMVCELLELKAGAEDK